MKTEPNKIKPENEKEKEGKIEESEELTFNTDYQGILGIWPGLVPPWLQPTESPALPHDVTKTQKADNKFSYIGMLIGGIIGFILGIIFFSFYAVVIGLFGGMILGGIIGELIEKRKKLRIK